MLRMCCDWNGYISVLKEAAGGLAFLSRLGKADVWAARWEGEGASPGAERQFLKTPVLHS